VDLGQKSRTCGSKGVLDSPGPALRVRRNITFLAARTVAAKRPCGGIVLCPNMAGQSLVVQSLLALRYTGWLATKRRAAGSCYIGGTYRRLGTS
jgi:hypothetical protein